MRHHKIRMSHVARFARRLGATASCGTVLALVAANAVAQESSADTAAARSFAQEGLKLAEAGKCDQAIDKLSRAEKLHHSPIVLSKLGECLVAQGRVVEGSEALRKMLREPLPPNPSPALNKAYERAQAALEAAKPQIASVSIAVKAPAGVEPTVTIDGQPVPAAVLGGERPTDPGDHLVEATAPGYLKASTRFNVGPGRKQSVELTLERDPDAPVAPPPGSAANGSTTSATPPTSAGTADTPPQTDLGTQGNVSAAPNRTAAYIAWAVGGVGLAVGGGFGFMAMKDKNDLKDSCPNDVCSPDQQDKLDSAKRNGNIATVGLGVGAAGLILGTVLFFTASSDSASAPHKTLAARDRRYPTIPSLRPRAEVGLGRVQLGVDF